MTAIADLEKDGENALFVSIRGNSDSGNISCRHLEQVFRPEIQQDSND